MEISLSNKIIIKAVKSFYSVVNTYKEVIPEIEFDHDPEAIDISKIEPIVRKWGALHVKDDQLFIKINDELLEDFIEVFATIYIKFAPIVGVAKSMIPMLKGYFKDYQDAFVPVVKKYLEEYDYAVEEVKFTGVKHGFVMLRKNKNGGKWTHVEHDIELVDEYTKMSKAVRRHIFKEAILETVSGFNEKFESNVVGLSFNIYPDQASAAEAMMAMKEDMVKDPDEKDNDEPVITVLDTESDSQ